MCPVGLPPQQRTKQGPQGLPEVCGQRSLTPLDTRGADGSGQTPQNRGDRLGGRRRGRAGDAAGAQAPRGRGSRGQPGPGASQQRPRLGLGHRRSPRVQVTKAKAAAWSPCAEQRARAPGGTESSLEPSRGSGQRTRAGRHPPQRDKKGTKHTPAGEPGSSTKPGASRGFSDARGCSPERLESAPVGRSQLQIQREPHRQARSGAGVGFASGGTRRAGQHTVFSSPWLFLFSEFSTGNGV